MEIKLRTSSRFLAGSRGTNFITSASDLSSNKEAASSKDGSRNINRSVYRPGNGMSCSCTINEDKNFLRRSFQMYFETIGLWIGTSVSVHADTNRGVGKRYYRSLIIF